MIVYYRISDGSYPKERFPFATKENCLKNFLKNCFDAAEDEMFLYADNVEEKTYTDIQRWTEPYADSIALVRSNAGSSAASFRLVFEESIKLLDHKIVWFQEDDYWYLPNSRRILLEGLERADYVSLYAHPDKFIPASKGGNKFIGDDGGEQTTVILTKSSFWMLTNSTTCTFATRAETLKDDAEIWRRHTTGTYPRDFDCFIELRFKGKSLITPIPGLSTHCEPTWQSPLIDWKNLIKEVI